MKKILKICSFTLLMLVLLLGCYRILSWKDTSGEYISAIQQLSATPENTVDIVFVGSSHVYCGVAPHVFWNDSGIAAFDMSVSGMDKWSELQYTKYFLKKQSPKMICVDAFSFTYDKHEIESNEYRNMLSMPDSVCRYELINQYSGDDKDRKKNYLLRWPIIHTRYKEFKKDDFVPEGFELLGRGENLQRKSVGEEHPLSANLDTKDTIELDSDSIRIIDEYIKIGEEKNIPILFLVTPYPEDYEAVAVYNAISDYVKDKENAYFSNCIGEMDTIVSADFFDATHLNRYGAEKFSKWILDYVKEIVSFEDHRGTPEYQLWDEDAVYYYIDDVSESLKNEFEAGASSKEILSEVVNYDFLTYIVSFDGEYEKHDYPYDEILEIIGALPKELYSGATFVGNCGESVKVIDKNVSGPVFYQLDRYNEVRLSKDTSDDFPSIMINDADYQNAYDGVSIVIWDSFNKKVVLAGGWN